jgi:hypothetical protein
MSFTVDDCLLQLCRVCHHLITYLITAPENILSIVLEFIAETDMKYINYKTS